MSSFENLDIEDGVTVLASFAPPPCSNTTMRPLDARVCSPRPTHDKEKNPPAWVSPLSSQRILRPRPDVLTKKRFFFFDIHLSFCLLYSFLFTRVCLLIRLMSERKRDGMMKCVVYDRPNHVDSLEKHNVGDVAKKRIHVEERNSTHEESRPKVGCFIELLFS